MSTLLFSAPATTKIKSSRLSVDCKMTAAKDPRAKKTKRTIIEVKKLNP